MRNSATVSSSALAGGGSSRGRSTLAPSTAAVGPPSRGGAERKARFVERARGAVVSRLDPVGWSLPINDFPQVILRMALCFMLHLKRTQLDQFVARVPGGLSRGRCTLRRRGRYYQLCRRAARRYLKMGRSGSAWRRQEQGSRIARSRRSTRCVATAVALLIAGSAAGCAWPDAAAFCKRVALTIRRGTHRLSLALARVEEGTLYANAEPDENQSRGRGAYSSTRMLFSMLTRGGP